MLSLVVDAHHCETTDDSFVFIKNMSEKCDYIVSARPTAINLSNVVAQLKIFLAGLSPDELTINNLKSA